MWLHGTFAVSSDQIVEFVKELLMPFLHLSGELAQFRVGKLGSGIAAFGFQKSFMT